MEKKIVDKKFVELLESYDYEFMGDFTFVFDFTRYKTSSELTIKMLSDGSEKCAYCITLFATDSGLVTFKVATDYSMMEYELEFFSQIAEDKKKIMAMYNEVA